MTGILARSGVWTTVLKLTVTLLVSILIPLFTEFATDSKGNPLLSSFEQFMLGSIIFLGITLISASHDVSEMLKLRKQEYQLWEMRNDVDTMLSNMSTAFTKILGKAPLNENLFAQYFQRVLSEVSESIHMASTRQELRVDELTFGTTDLLLGIMERRGRDTLRLIHSLDARPNNFDFSPWARSYYQELTRLAGAKKISVKRLFIFGAKSDMETPIAQDLFAFHASNHGYEYRAISRTDWMAIVRGNRLPEAHSEFGVWGDILVYTAIRSSPTHMEGAYFSLPQTVERFREVFDAGWRLATVPTYTPQISNPIRVDELFMDDLKQRAPKSAGELAATQISEEPKLDP